VPKQSCGEAEGITTPDKLELRTKEGIPSRLKITPLAPLILRGEFGVAPQPQDRAFLSLRGTIAPKQSRGEAEGIATPNKLELTMTPLFVIARHYSAEAISWRGRGDCHARQVGARNDKRQGFRTTKDLVEINSTTVPQMKIESPFCGTI